MAKTNNVACSLLQNESDDEESFVVLGHSLPPESLTLDCSCEATESIRSNIVQESLKLTDSALSQLRVSTASSSFPSFPKVDQNDLVIPSEESFVNHSIQSSVDLGPDEIQQKVDSLVKENIKLKETLHQNNLAMKKQYDTLMLWQADVQKVHQSHKEKFAETKKFIENLKLENTKLLEALKISQTAHTKALEELDRLQNKKELKTMSENGDNNSQISNFDNVHNIELYASLLKPQPSKIQHQEQQIEMPTSKETELSNRVQELEKDLAAAKQLNAQISADCNKKLYESDSLQTILLQEIKTLKLHLTEKVDSVISKEDHKIVQEQLVAAQMHLTNLELQRNQDKDIINAKEETIAKLQDSLQEMVESKDTIVALRAQLELYKSDFEAERQAKESIKSEKEQIAEDLQHLQRRNQQLLEEVERLRSGDFVHVARPGPTVPPAPSAPQDRRTEFPCPKCDFRFRNYQALENHVYRCIEIDSLF